MVDIRTLTPENVERQDFEKLVELYVTCFGHRLEGTGVNINTVARNEWESSLPDPHATSIAAFDGEDPVGFMIAKEMDVPTKLLYTTIRRFAYSVGHPNHKGLKAAAEVVLAGTMQLGDIYHPLQRGDLKSWHVGPILDYEVFARKYGHLPEAEIPSLRSTIIQKVGNTSAVVYAVGVDPEHRGQDLVGKMNEGLEKRTS